MIVITINCEASSMRKCGLTLETDCNCRHTVQEPNWLETVSKTLGLIPQNVGSNPTTRKLLEPQFHPTTKEGGF